MSKLQVSSAQAIKEDQPEEKSLGQEASDQRKHQVQGRLKLKCRPSFPGIPNIINTKIKAKNQQPGDDYTTLSTTTKITRGKP